MPAPETATVDTERLVGSFLRAQPAVSDIVDGRVYSVVPEAPTFPLVLVQQVGGSRPYTVPLWRHAALLQVDCYGGPKALARRLMDAVVPLLATQLVGVHDLGVVTGVELGLDRYLPDTSRTPAQPRWLFEVTVSTHS